MKPSNLKGHMTRCPLTVISCEYAYAGCLLMMYRKDMKNHLEVAKQEHLLLLSGKVKEMEAEIQKLKSENASKDLKIRLLTNHEHNEDKETVPATRTLVTNFPPQTDIDLVKSVFGQFGRVKRVQWYGDEGIAVVEYMESRSICRMFDRHHAAGIHVRKKKLDVSLL